MSRTYGSYMIQPSKDQYRDWLSKARRDLKDEKSRRQLAEYKLRVANRVFGELVLQGTISIPTERLGELALQIEGEKQIEHDKERLLAGIVDD